MPNFLFFLEGTDEVGGPSGFCWWRDKDSKLRGNTAISKGELVDDVDDVAAYAVPYDCPHVLGWRTASLSVLERVSLVRQEAKSHACRYLETMGESVDLALHFQVVVEDVAVKIAELQGVPLQGGASK